MMKKVLAGLLATALVVGSIGYAFASTVTDAGSEGTIEFEGNNGVWPPDKVPPEVIPPTVPDPNNPDGPEIPGDKLINDMKADDLDFHVRYTSVVQRTYRSWYPGASFAANDTPGEGGIRSDYFRPWQSRTGLVINYLPGTFDLMVEVTEFFLKGTTTDAMPNSTLTLIPHGNSSSGYGGNYPVVLPATATFTQHETDALAPGDEDLAANGSGGFIAMFWEGEIDAPTSMHTGDAQADIFWTLVPTH